MTGRPGSPFRLEATTTTGVGGALTETALLEVIEKMRSMDRPCPRSRHRCDCYSCLRDLMHEQRRCGCRDCFYEFKKTEERLHYTQYRENHMYQRGMRYERVVYDEYATMDPKQAKALAGMFEQQYTVGIDLGLVDKGYTPKQLTSGDDMNLVEKVKNLKLSAADKLLRKHGVVDAEGDLTETGQDLIWGKLLDQFKTELVADLKAVDAEAKGKK